MQMLFISSTFYKNKIKMIMITLFSPENFRVVFFVNGNIFFPQHILNKAKIHTILLFKVSFDNNLIGVFYNCNAK